MAADETCAILSSDALHGILGHAEGLAVTKSRTCLDQHSKAFIARAPFLVIGTSNGAGRADVSPRGDPPGFVHVLSDTAILIPDRPGNNRADTMDNIIANPCVGILVLVPGFEDTLRLNGKARITRDSALLAVATVNGKAPKVGILVDIEEVFFHCAKALKRSRLWDPDTRQDRRSMPSLARIILEQTAEADRPPTEAAVADSDAYVEENYRTELY